MASSIQQSQTQMAPLTPVLSEKYALKWQHAAFCGFFAVLFLMLSHAPLRLEGPWQSLRLGSASLGSAGWGVSTLGVDDPGVPLSAGMQQPQLSWLTSAILARVYAAFGVEGVSQLSALVLFATYLLWARCFFRLSQSKLGTAIAILVLFFTTNGYFGSAGPATFAFLCATVLTWLLLPIVHRDVRRDAEVSLTSFSAELGAPYLWWSVPLVMALWCNLSGTFLVGIAMLVAIVVGCAFEAGAALSASEQTRNAGRSWTSFWRSRRFQQSVYLLELSILATCLHPLGVKVWAAVFTPNQNPFWIAAGGSADFYLSNLMGKQMIVATLIGLWICRSSRLRIAVADVVTVALLFIPAMYNARLFVWTVPAFLLFAVPHLAFRFRGRVGEGAGQGARSDKEEGAPAGSGERKPLQFAFSLLCLLLIWMAFAFSPLSTPLLGGAARPAARLHAKEVPQDVAAFFAENPTDGLVWAPSYWSDWISFHSHSQAEMFATSNMAILPGQVQRDYQRVATGAAIWDRTLGRYAVQTLVIDKNEQDRLFNVVLSNAEGWRIVFESNTAIVLKRKDV